MRGALLLALLAACPSPQKAPLASRPEGGASGETPEAHRKRLIAELEDEILSSYERDDVPDIDTPLIPANVGPARIGVGPGDVLFGDEVRLRASSRWPLFVSPSMPTSVRSKRLDVHLSHDHQPGRMDPSAAWMSDEVSWRIGVCGHTAAIPLRITALYAHDGDRWVEVFEHLSFARMPQPYYVLAGDNKYEVELRGSPMIRPGEQPIVDRRLADDLSRVLQALFSRNTARIEAVVATDPTHAAEDDPSRPAPTFVLAPDPDSEWHGDQDVARLATLVDGTLRAEDRRIGTIGTSPDKATIAYWVGNFVADLGAQPGIAAGKVRLRGTFVFEKREGRWIVVQGHLSEPIDDADLAMTVFGTSLISDKPLAVTCD
ncbi:MAG: hypothetical protein ACM31C_26350 [Acidobacteriota bacterium]